MDNTLSGKKTKKSLVFIWWFKSLAYICTQETKQKQNERLQQLHRQIQQRVQI